MDQTIPPAQNKKILIWKALPFIAGILFLCLTLYAAKVETPTVDEFAHLPAGCAYLSDGRFDLYAKNPPLMKILLALPIVMRSDVTVPEVNVPPLGWGPWQYGYQFMLANWDQYFGLFLLGRLVVIVLGLLTGVLIYFWARDLFDTRAASIVTALFYLSPTILAHSHLATIDVACMFSCFLAVFAFRWAYKQPTLIRLVIAGVVWGIALLVKFTAVLLLLVFCILVVVFRWNAKKRAAIELGLLVCVALLVVNLGMGFQGSFQTLNHYRLQSQFGQSLQKVLPSWLPVPLPKDYVIGFDAQKLDAEVGEFGSYLAGKWSKRGWWYYNLVAFGVKTPIPFLAMLALCLWFLRRRRLKQNDLLCLLVPPAILLFMMIAFNRLNIGIRYLLPIFPFLFLMIGAIWHQLQGRWAHLLAGAILSWYAITSIASAPAHLSFFNLAVGGPKNGHRLLIDSNLDWGQDLYRLKPALAKLGYDGKIGLLYFGHVHPHLYGLNYELIPSHPVKGVLAVSVSYLMGQTYVASAPDHQMVPIKSGHLNWLRNHEPILRLGSIWIFDTRG